MYFLPAQIAVHLVSMHMHRQSQDLKMGRYHLQE